jgi:hypothetical protein
MHRRVWVDWKDGELRLTNYWKGMTQDTHPWECSSGSSGQLPSPLWLGRPDHRSERIRGLNPCLPAGKHRQQCHCLAGRRFCKLQGDVSQNQPSKHFSHFMYKQKLILTASLLITWRIITGSNRLHFEQRDWKHNWEWQILRQEQVYRAPSPPPPPRLHILQTNKLWHKSYTYTS